MPDEGEGEGGTPRGVEKQTFPARRPPAGLYHLPPSLQLTTAGVSSTPQ